MNQRQINFVTVLFPTILLGILIAHTVTLSGNESLEGSLCCTNSDTLLEKTI